MSKPRDACTDRGGFYQTMKNKGMHLEVEVVKPRDECIDRGDSGIHAEVLALFWLAWKTVLLRLCGNGATFITTAVVR